MFPFFMENTMPLSCNTTPNGASNRNPGTIDLEALLGDSDAQLVHEGLYRLREAKVEALQIVQAAGLSPNGHAFKPWDFGIPQIDRLLSRFGAAPEENMAGGTGAST